MAGRRAREKALGEERTLALDVGLDAQLPGDLSAAF
jgi:hypothetical protein